MEGTGAMHNFSNAVENRLVPGSTETSTEEKRLSEGDETLSGSLSALLQRVAEGRVIGATNPVSGKASKTREDHAAVAQLADRAELRSFKPRSAGSGTLTAGDKFP